MALKAAVVHLKRVALFVLRNDPDDPLGFFAVERLGAPLFNVRFHRVLRAARPKMLVPFAHVAVREPGFLFEHFVDQLVQFVHVL